MPRRKHYCEFCGKGQEEVERLLAGPFFEVCNECIDTMHKIIHEPKPLLPMKPGPKPRTVIPFRGRQ